MASKAKTQRGGFGVGVVVGLLGGLVLALGVAVFVTKAPVPFVDKVPGRTAEQDAAEAEKNRQWDPNAPLHGRPKAALFDPARATRFNGDWSRPALPWRCCCSCCRWR